MFEEKVISRSDIQKSECVVTENSVKELLKRTNWYFLDLSDDYRKNILTSTIPQGSYYFHARWYDPELGVFLTKDPAAPSLDNPTRLNPYNFCGNNPVNNVDPDGRWFFALLAAAFWGGVIKTGVDMVSRWFTGEPNSLENCWMSFRDGAAVGAVGYGFGATFGSVNLGSGLMESSISSGINAGIGSVGYGIATGQNMSWENAGRMFGNGFELGVASNLVQSGVNWLESTKYDPKTWEAIQAGRNYVSGSYLNNGQGYEVAGITDWMKARNITVGVGATSGALDLSYGFGDEPGVGVSGTFPPSIGGGVFFSYNPTHSPSLISGGLGKYLFTVGTYGKCQGIYLGVGCSLGLPVPTYSRPLR